MSQVRRPSAAAQSLLLWTLSFLHPHRGRVVLMIVLLLVQIGLGALQPWPLKIVIDYVLDGNPLPEPLRHWTVALVPGGGSGAGVRLFASNADSS